MIYCIAVFHSKTDVFLFMNYLKRSGVFCETVGTPKEAKVGCGLSVRFLKNNLSVAREILNSVRFNSFYAMYQVQVVGFRSVMSKIF